MVSAYVSCAIIVLLALVLGHAIHIACGSRGWRWSSPAVGFAALLIIVDVVIRLPGAGWTSLGATAVFSSGSMISIARHHRLQEARLIVLATIPSVLAVALLASSNYLINGRVGIPGVSILNDFAGHLPWAEALSDGRNPFKLIIPGYPLGPFALSGTLAKLPGVTVLGAFQGLLIATPVLIALTVLSLFRHLGIALRTVAAAVVALSYLLTAALAEGAFKEPIEALLIIGIAISLLQIATDNLPQHRSLAVPIAILVAGSIANYSYPGLSWPGLLIALWLLIEFVRRRAVIDRAVLKRLLTNAAVGVPLLAFLSLPEALRFHAFQQTQVSTINAQTGNVPVRIPWRETLGIWFSNDFRTWQKVPLDVQHTFLLFGAAILAFGAFQAWRRGESSLLALLAAAVIVALYTRGHANPYNGAKAIMVLGGATTLVMMRGLLPTQGATPGSRGKSRTHWGMNSVGALVAVLFATAALWSDALIQRGSQVGPSVHTNELAKLASALVGQKVLFLGQDDFAAWELRGTDLGYLTQYDIPSRPIFFRNKQAIAIGSAVDFNSFSTETLNEYNYVIATRSDFASVPPPNWQPVASSRFYRVWRRRGITRPFSTLSPEADPGVMLDCSNRGDKTLSRSRGVALVQSKPETIAGAAWRGPVAGRGPGFSALSAGTAVSGSVTLPRGRWQLSLQYVSSTSVLVRADALRSGLPAALEHLGPYWPVGEIASVGRPTTVRIYVNPPPALATARSALLGNAAFARTDLQPRLVPLHAACGHYVDWYRP